MSWILTEVWEDSCAVNPSSDGVNLNSLPMKLQGRGAAFWSVWWTDIQQHQGIACNERKRERERERERGEGGGRRTVWHLVHLLMFQRSVCWVVWDCRCVIFLSGEQVERKRGCRTSLFCAAMWTEPYPKMSLKWSLHYRDCGTKAEGIKQGKSNVVQHTLEVSSFFIFFRAKFEFFACRCTTLRSLRK